VNSDHSSIDGVEAHRLVGARQCLSPNCNERPPGQAPELVVIHCISLPPGRFGSGDVDRLFTNCLDPERHPDYPELCAMQVSAHLLVDRRGECTQFVPFDLRAWHAGVSSWQGRPGCNDYSIGIELEGADDVPYEEAQYRTLARVIRALWAAYPTLGRNALAGHSEIAPGRKTDPGPAFDWARLRELLA
jgi:AmpD protein